MFGSHQHPQPKRRKKRPIHGVKTVDVTRGKSGYGFTISGQHPCVLSCIVSSSPAAQVGLRPGDYLISVNSKDVSKLGHDEVVRMVGMSTGTLTVQVAENYNSSDSSDEDYVPRNKLKYPNRAKRGHHRGYVEKMDKLLADINHRDRYCPDGHSHDPNSRPLNANKNEPPRSRSSRPRLHTPVGAENHEIQAQGTSYIEAGASNVFKVPFQKSVSTSNVQTHHRVEPKQAFIKSTSQIHFKSNPSVNGASRVGNIPGHMYDHFSPNSLQQIINHSLHSYSAANEAFILDEFDEDGDEDPLKQDGGEIRIVVGYIGSLEMPGDVTQPHIRIQSIRNSVRRLRLEQKIHTLVLMVVSNNGVKLINIGGKEIANYSIDRLVFCGVCPDDRRFFGIVTLNIYNLDSSSDSDSRDEPASSSCHIFMVDQEMAAHNIHGQKAKYFGIVCSVDPHTQRCMEFPRSTTPIIMSISNLYKDRPGGSLENDVARSKVLSDPNRPVEPDQSSSASSSINSNSDSGLGLFRDDKGVDQALVVDMPPPPAPPPLPVRDRPPAQYPQIKWSGNTVHLTEGPVKVFTPSASDKLISKKSQSPNVLLHDTSTSSEEFIRATGKLNIRAMPDPSPKKEKENDGLEYQNAAENLRKHSQKLLQARRQVMLDQTSSDTESVSSRSDKVPFVLNAKERPVSAPFKYLSDDSNVGLHTSFRNDVMHGKHDSDSSLMDKLSPRAFLSSAFTPVGSVGSAFKKIRSRPILHELRSPSAPPIPSYHGDDEDSEEEAVKGIIKQLHQEKGLGVQVGSNSKKTRKRDQERRAVTANENTVDLVKPTTTTTTNTEKWVKTPIGSGRKKSTRRNPLSLSHESLVVFEQDPAQQKLSSASSVNSIVNHVAKSIEQESVGRVSGWAVNFDKLLKDVVGIAVFTDFLKKEFSEENIEFWKVCEVYRNIIDSNFRKSKAKEIYESYISVRAQSAVNIDSVARKHVEGELESPTPQTFEVPQQQIFQLMKQDSYARFLKSDSYKSWLMKEMEGQSLVMPQEDSLTDKEKLLDKALEKDSKKKGKGKENDDNKDKRRRSLLPWRQKSKKNKDEKNSKTSKDTKENPEVANGNNNNNNNVPKSTNSTPLTDLPGSRKEANARKDSVQLEVPETIEEEMEQPRFCRVIMPDGSTTVVGTKQGQTINYVLGKLLEKRSLSIASVDVFLLGSEKPLNLNEDIAILGSKEVSIERRVLFRMDLPNKKSIGVKAKPNRLIRDVFKPILNKYGFRIEAIDVHLCGHSESLNLESLVSTIDSQRVIVLIQSEESTARKNSLIGRYIQSSLPLTNMLTSKLGLFGPQNNNSNMITHNNHQNELGPFDRDEITNQIFGDLMLDKSDQLLQPNFDELGILDLGPMQKVRTGGEQVPLVLHNELVKKDMTDGPEVSTKETTRTGRPKQKVTFALQKNMVRNQHDEDEVEKALCENLKRAQNLSMDDQRGLAPHDLQLPEFLQKRKEELGMMTGRGSAPALLMHDKNDSLVLEKRDFMSEIDDYIENITDNFAAYTKESGQQRFSLSGTDPRKLTHLKTFQSFDDSVDMSNSNFSRDGIVPSSDEADELFQPPRPEDVDFSDPYLTEKSLVDIGFSYDYNKYLSKSRNFVNQRNHHASQVTVQPNISSLSVETFSPNRTLTDESDGGLDSTLLNSPKVSHSSRKSSHYSILNSPKVSLRGSRHSSPCSSDSSVDKENFGKFVPQSHMKKVQGSSRHTLTHSPITALSGDTILSTVDTDGKMVPHSTPKTTGIKVNTAGNLSRFNLQTTGLNLAHTDEITFV